MAAAVPCTGRRCAGCGLELRPVAAGALGWVHPDGSYGCGPLVVQTGQAA